MAKKDSEPYAVKAARQTAGNPVVVPKPNMFPEQEKVLRKALDDGLTAGHIGQTKPKETDQ